MEKQCSTCGELMPIEDFYKCGNLKSGAQRYSCECKDCRRKRENARYYDLAADVAAFRGPCARCGLDKPYLIEFHHRDPGEKEFVIAHWRKRSRRALMDELQKCDPLCRNCHAEFHYLHDRNGITYSEYIKG